jgi:hypothetical protein
MPDEPDPLPAGATGTVDWVSDTSSLTRHPSFQLGVKWDEPYGHRSLMLVCPPDAFRRIPKPDSRRSREQETGT